MARVSGADETYQKLVHTRYVHRCMLYGYPRSQPGRPVQVDTWADLVNPQTRLKNDFLTYVQRCTDGVRKIFFTQFDKEAERSAWFLDVEPRLATHPVDGRQLNDIVTQATGDPQDGDLWIDIEETFVNYVTADAGPNGERLYRKL